MAWVGKLRMQSENWSRSMVLVQLAHVSGAVFVSMHRMHLRSLSESCSCNWALWKASSVL